MRWIVDGMNLIGSRPDGWWRDRPAAQRRLVVQLGEFGRSSGDAVEVVFDGRPRAQDVADGEELGVVVSFAPGGPDAADRVIASMTERSEAPAAITVVTSDARLAAAVRNAGVDVMGVKAFRRLLESPAPPP